MIRLRYANELVGLLVILAFLFIDWRRLLEHKELRLRFAIWKGSRHPGRSGQVPAEPRRGHQRTVSRKR